MEERQELEALEELLQTKQYTRLRQYLSEMNDADIATFMDELEEEEMLKVPKLQCRAWRKPRTNWGRGPLPVLSLPSHPGPQVPIQPLSG